jgi:hypothetical protein
MGAAFAILMASLFLSSMSAFNALVKTVSVLSLLNYYRPYGILQGQTSPLGDMIVLLGLGLGLWICGLTVFIRRDIRAA